MITVKIFDDDIQIDEMQIILVGGGLQGLEGPSGYDYKLMKPKHEDMPHIEHKPEDGHLVLIAKTLLTFLQVSDKKVNNIIQFPLTNREEEVKTNIVEKFIEYSKQERFIEVNEPIFKHEDKTLKIRCYKFKYSFINEEKIIRGEELELFEIVLGFINGKFNKQSKVFIESIQLVNIANASDEIIIRCVSEDTPENEFEDEE
jgi:hypothetical protein